MLIAMHIDVKDWSNLLGVWVAPEGSDGFPDCFYPDPERGLAVGRGRMEVKGAAVNWSAFFWRLQSASPYSAYWSVREVVDDVTLPELFETLAIEVVESAESLAGMTKTVVVPLDKKFTMVVPGVTVSTPSLEELAAAVGGPIPRFTPKQKLSTLCGFFADEHRMVVVARADTDQTTADLALAWGLAYRCDRQLSVVLPENCAKATLVRVPWLLPSVRVFTHLDGVVSEPLPLTREQSIKALSNRTWDASAVAVLGDKSNWVQAVVDWASLAPGIDRVERSSYVAWHVAGRQVLKMIPTKKRLTVIAGVDSTKPDDWDPSVKVILNERALHHQLHAIIAAASKAASVRLAGDDTGHREHRMQAALNPTELGLVGGWLREFPAWRPGSNRAAYMDFLAKDDGGRVHVLETKIGADAMLVFQGLDYWLYCRANIDHVNRSVGATSTRPPVINYVVAPSKPGGEPVSIYTAAQAEALHRDIEWRFVVVDDPDTGAGIHRLDRYRLPEPHRRADGGPARWAVRLHHHLIGAAAESGVALKRTHSFPDAHQALVPGAIPAYEQLQADGVVHTYFSHVRSSQAFALNMLAPLTPQAWTEIARHHLGDPDAQVVEPVAFEYTDPDDALAEATKASPHATQVDCLVRVRLGNGRTHAMLIEVKLSEDNFSTCSAYMSPNNTRQAICAQPGPFGGDPTGCFQLANHDREHRRRYDEMLGRPRDEPVTFGCWFRDGANQVMRNAALAKALIVRGEVESASMLLMAPDDHTAIWEQWHRHIALLSQYDNLSFADLPASHIAALHEPTQARTLSARYLLPIDALEVRMAQRLIDTRFPAGAALIRLNHDDTINYVQSIERLPVVQADTDQIVFLTPYPAGPFVHHTLRSEWENDTGDLTIPAPDGQGSRIITADHTALTESDQQQLPADAHRSQQRFPWWTAPVQ